MREGNSSLTPRDAGASAAQHTPGPWTYYADLPSTAPNWHIVTNASRMRVLANVHIEPGNSVDEVNARLITAAPLLEVIANATGLYMWESLSDAFHQNLSQQRKAELLAAYRAFAGYRDGRLTMEQAWAEVAPLAKATQPAASRGEATPNSTAELGA